MNAVFARQLLEKHGSPLFVYDLDAVKQRAQTLLAALPEGSRLYYSFKANPLPAIASW